MGQYAEHVKAVIRRLVAYNGEAVIAQGNNAAIIARRQQLMEALRTLGTGRHYPIQQTAHEDDAPETFQVTIQCSLKRYKSHPHVFLPSYKQFLTLPASKSRSRASS